MYLEEEDICTLHARVEDLRGGQVVRLIAPHDLLAPDDAPQLVLAGDVHHQAPVLAGSAIDLV